MHLPAVQSSSYIDGAQEMIVWNGLSLYVMWTCSERLLAWSQAASGVPANKPSRLFSEPATRQKQSLSTFTMAPARSTTLRTGVHLLPMIMGLVTTAPSQ